LQRLMILEEVVKMQDNTRREICGDVVVSLSDLIRDYLTIAAHEQYYPNSNPDQMDATIADAKEKARELRRLREEFENITTGVIGEI
jgi:hypothetical protein